MLRLSDAWQARLPVELQDLVDVPERVEAFHDDGVPASKWRGYDRDGSLCYYRHVFSMWEDVADDDEPYRRLVLSESLEAWRCKEGGWLRHLRRDSGAGRCFGQDQDRGFEHVGSHEIPRL